MADWRQIQARIRKAKASSDPAGQLTELYEKTHDGMVAFELARWVENAGPSQDVVRWYTAAAEHFRRADWKKKAEDALLRLGAPLPPHSPSEPAIVPPAQDFSVSPSVPPETLSLSGAISSSDPKAAGSALAAPVGATPAGRKRTRRGRRGGRRRHRREGKPGAVAAGTATTAGLGEVAAAAPQAQPEPEREALPGVAAASETQRVERERSATLWGSQSRGRAGEPALASRLAQLESLLRRLLASAIYPLDSADEAPAGPGVYLLSDSDLTTSYFVESCKTLRVALGQLARGRSQRTERHDSSLRARMAEHLGISESRVSKYLKDHCVVRWIQLDEDAGHLAHFAVAVLRPALNFDE